MSEPIWSCGGKGTFAEELYWKMHRIADAKSDKLEIALGVNDKQWQKWI